jgi:CRISPR-associated protein Cmr1
MRLQLKTLTPIWTGGSDRYCDRLHETGLIGSIRWWYEAIARGFGLKVCDIISDDRCPKTINKNGNRHKEWCDACEIFGATGKCRMFRLIVQKDGIQTFLQSSSKGGIKIKPYGSKNGWYRGAGRYSSSENPICLDILPLRGDQKQWKRAVLPALVLIDRWGAIGSRVQHGFGVVNILDEDDKRIQIDETENYPPGSEDKRILPNLKDFFFSKVRLSPKSDIAEWIQNINGLMEDRRSRNNIEKSIETMPGSIPSAPSVKNWLRYTFLKNIKNNKQIDKTVQSGFLFGYAEGDNKQASKIAVSDIYQQNNEWEFRIWGWLPLADGKLSETARDVFLKCLKHALIQNDAALSKALGYAKINSIEWRQYDSESDSQDEENKFHEYFRSLLQ